MFNMNSLQTRVDEAFIKQNGGRDVHGITNSMAFISSSGSWFPWHPEEMNLGSANYMHKVARTVSEFKDVPPGEKVWFFIPKYHAHVFEEAVTRLLHEADVPIQCANFLMHRYLALDHRILNKLGIDTYWYCQKEGDLIVTFPYCFHSGMCNLYNY